jgi:hypothetical protein
MIRIILLAVLFFMLVASGVAVALYHFFGWKGLIAMPFILVAMVGLAVVVIKALVRKILAGLIAAKSAVLRDAKVEVRAVTPVSKSQKAEAEPIDDDEDDEPEDDDAEEDEEESLHYFEIEMVITPASDKGDAVWAPGELMLTSKPVTRLDQLSDEETDFGSTVDYQIWNGQQYADDDDDGKVPGPQRLRAIFAVKPGARTAWLQYYDQPLCQVQLPVWDEKLFIR